MCDKNTLPRVELTNTCLSLVLRWGYSHHLGGWCEGDSAKVWRRRSESPKMWRCGGEGAILLSLLCLRLFICMELTISFNDNYSYKYGVCGKNSPIRKVYILLILHGIGYMYVEATSQSHVYWISCNLGMLMA